MQHAPPQSDNPSRSRTIALALTVILSGLITILMLGPVRSPSIFPGIDKIYHLIAFAALLIPSAYLYRPALYYILPSAVLFGGAIEILQPYVNRTGDMADFGADVIGSILGIAIGLMLRHIFRSRSHTPHRPN